MPGCFLVDMAGLRIELARKGEDLVLRHMMGAIVEHTPRWKIFEGEARHLAISQLAKRKCITSPSATT